jgi:Uri superfamily endonuclease
MTEEELNLPASKGIYLLVFYLSQVTEITIGRQGKQTFAAGWWFYVGSAYGPGGLRARLKHHIAHKHKRLHWHLDYFRPYAQLNELLLFDESRDFEHQIADYLGTELKLAYPEVGFGASDCDCPSHMFYSPVRVNLCDNSFFLRSRQIKYRENK